MKSVTSKESLMLFSICFADTLLTIALLITGFAEEANPIMRWVLKFGITAFYVVKMATVIPMIMLSEWYRKQNPVFAKLALQTAIATYLGLYFVSVLIVNAT